MSALSNNYILYTDGGARGNPGPAGAGVLLIDPKGKEVAANNKYLGIKTNNEAEYFALILGLRTAQLEKVKNLKCFLDSELVVRQLNGLYKVKNTRLKELYTKVKSLEAVFEHITYEHIPREQNSVADTLVNNAIDEAKNS